MWYNKLQCGTRYYSNNNFAPGVATLTAISNHRDAREIMNTIPTPFMVL